MKVNRMDEIRLAERTDRVRDAVAESGKPFVEIIRKAGICSRTLYDVMYYGRIPAKNTLDAIEKGLRK